MNTKTDIPQSERESSGTQFKQNEFRDDVIMMVDDEPLMTGILEVYLEAEGYENFIAVHDSSIAVESVLREQPDCLFLDLNMPGVDGFEVLTHLRANPETQHLAVIVLTSDTDSETKLKALELGATDFLEKPIDASEVILRLRNTLRAKAYQDQLTYCDALTRLPNRALFQERLESGVEYARQHRFDLALMVVSIDRFQAVNDSLGPMAGDDVLKQIANRLRSASNDGGFDRKGRDQGARCLARLGGDEFAISIPGRLGKSEVVEIAEDILDELRKPFDYRGKQVFLTASVGLARYSHDAGEASLLLKCAGAATESAKKQGGNMMQQFSKEITANADARRSLEADLHNALEKKELRLHFQPQIEVDTGRVSGMEALVRWHHPTRGLVVPDEFIPLAEESDLIRAIDSWVLEEACRQTRALHTAGYRGLNISVNVSARQFENPDLAWFVSNACAQSGVPPRSLTLELTESLVMADTVKAAKMLQQLKDIGVTISIDDFGTGYSSLAYLKRFPIDELKIDRSFIMEIPTRKDDSAIVKAVIAMARSLDLKVVAEGVETAAQMQFLKENNCHSAQGHVILEALPKQEFTSFLAQNWGKTGTSTGTGQEGMSTASRTEAVARPEMQRTTQADGNGQR